MVPYPPVSSDFSKSRGGESTKVIDNACSMLLKDSSPKANLSKVQPNFQIKIENVGPPNLGLRKEESFIDTGHILKPAL